MYTITSKDNNKIKYACSLKESKYRKKYQQFLGETFKSLEMAISSNIVTDVFVTEWKDIPEDINQYIVSEEVLKKISSNVNPEVVFIADIKEIAPKKLDKILYLDHISDPGNMGTIIRTALAFSLDLVLISEDSVSIYNEKVINASKGAIYKMPIKIGKLKDYINGHQVVVTSLNEKSKSLYDISFKDKVILVVGNESHGVDKEILDLATDVVKIPIDNIDSLNVGVATGILIAELSRK